MAIRRRFNWLNQGRVDVPHLKQIESAVSNDFDELLNAFLVGQDKSYIIRGFEIEMTNAVGNSASSLQLIVDNGAVIHGASNESGSFFAIPTGTANESLDSTVNSIISGAFAASSINYVGLEFTREIDDSTSTQRFFFNPSTTTEISKNVPESLIFGYKIVISTTPFASNILPIALVTTNSDNNVIEVEDRRPLLYRVGTAGTTTPDPDATYSWTNHAEGRVENPYSSTDNTSPFRGGDKQILNLKEWMDATMSSIKELKGTSYWYDAVGDYSTFALLERFNYYLVDGGTISWEQPTSDELAWSSDLKIIVPNRAYDYTISAGSLSSFLDDEVAYVTLPAVGVTPSGPLTVNKVANSSYLLNAANSRNFIIAYRSGTKVYFGSGWQSGELESGEQIELGDGITDALITATGLTDENDSTPPYTSNDFITPNTSFTQGISELDERAKRPFDVSIASTLISIKGSEVQRAFDRVSKNVENGTYTIVADSTLDVTSGVATGDIISATPTAPTVPANEYVWMGFQKQADDKIYLIFGTPNAVAGSATYPEFNPFKGSIDIAMVLLQDDGTGSGGTGSGGWNFLAPTASSDLISFVATGASPSTDSIDRDLARYHDRLNLSTFEYATPNIGRLHAETLLDGASTSTYSVPDESFEFASASDNLTSTQMLDPEFLSEGKDLNKVELVSIWDLNKIDTAATYEVSKDGVNYNPISMSRIGNSDTYRGTLEFFNNHASGTIEVTSNDLNGDYEVTDITALASGAAETTDVTVLNTGSWYDLGAGDAKYFFLNGANNQRGHYGWVTVNDEIDPEVMQKITLNSYTSAVESDIGKTVNAASSPVGTLAAYNNDTQEWWIKTTSAHQTLIAASAAIDISSGTGAGTTTASAAYDGAIQITVVGSDTTTQVAVKMAAAIDAIGDFSCAVPTTATFTIVNIDNGISENVSDVNAGLTISTTTNGSSEYDFDSTAIIMNELINGVEYSVGVWMNIDDGNFLSTAFAYDHDLVQYTDETTEANDVNTNDMTLFPASPAVDDAYYFSYTQPFGKLEIDVGVAAVAPVWTLVWEYWNGSAWASITPTVNNLGDFDSTGLQSIEWNVPTDWEKTTVSTNLLKRYYVRVRISAFTSITTVPVGTQTVVTSGAIPAAAAAADRAIKINIPAGSNANVVATAIQTTMDADSAFSASVASDVVTITNAVEGFITSAVDSAQPTGFGISVTTEGSDRDVITIGGVALTEGTDWNRGVSTDLTAEELKKAININLNTVRAARSGSLITLTAESAGPTGNAITLVETDHSRDNFTLSGGTLSGGEIYAETIEYVAGDDGDIILNTSSKQAISQKFTLTDATSIKSMNLYLNKLGSPVGNVRYKIVKDSAGAPSVSTQDIVFSSSSVEISTLAAGDNTITKEDSFVLPAGTYHYVVETDDAYKVSFVGSTNELRVRADLASGTTGSRDYDGSTWSAESANTMLYHFEGNKLDLRVRITSSAGDKYLESYAIFYQEALGASYDSGIYRDMKYFSGSSNIDTFSINFLPDARLLNVYAIGTGQVFRFGDFSMSGNQILFPPNTFDAPGEEIVLEFLQLGGGGGDSSNENSALITANHLGSTDSKYDKSLAGRGFFLRRPDGTLREITLDNADNIVIYSV